MLETEITEEVLKKGQSRETGRIDEDEELFKIMFYCPKTNGWFKKEYIILLAINWITKDTTLSEQFQCPIEKSYE